ncbi:MAG: peptidylprolyl isomerase [Uliginosibacterium sp.]|nr:peptidylprolyl isomerase [Uliginosibacterium sp.]
MKGQVGVEITVADVKAEVTRLPPENRQEVLGNPNSVLQAAHGLYIKRALAARALKEKLDEKDLNAAILAVARDRLLAEMYLIKADGAIPDAETIEKLSKAHYEVNKTSFNGPEMVTARHILILKTKPDARTKAEEILAKIKAGEDFAKLATEFSDDTNSAKKGGLLEPFAKGRMVPTFEAAVFELAKPGDVSAVIESEFGFHVARLEARRPAGPRPYAEVKEDIRKVVLMGVSKERRRAVSDPIAEGAQPQDEAIQAFAASMRESAKEPAK